jgi:hypothetical protein
MSNNMSASRSANKVGNDYIVNDTTEPRRVSRGLLTGRGPAMSLWAHVGGSDAEDAARQYC